MPDGPMEAIAEGLSYSVQSAFSSLMTYSLQALSAESQDDLFRIIPARYEHRSIIITSNRDFAE